MKLVGGAILLAAAFLVAAILGGGNQRGSGDGAAPLVGGDTTQPERAAGPEESTDELGYPTFATKNTTRSSPRPTKRSARRR